MSVFFPAASAVGTELCVDIVIVDDIIIEPVEVFEVEASGGTFADNIAQVSITDNDSKSMM